MTRRDRSLTYEQDKLRRLELVAQHLDRAMGEFGSIAGSSYVGSLREFHDLVRVRLKLETVIRRVRKGLDWERRIVDKRSKS